MPGFTRRHIQMRRSSIINGIDVLFSRRLGGWVAVFGPSYAVHFLAPRDGCKRWVAKRPSALEPIATGRTLTEAFNRASEHYLALEREVAERIARRLAGVAHS